MPVEVQKDITFDDIRIGDLIVVKLFGKDGSFLGDRRGYAISQREHGVWTFSGMGSLYREALGYRLFKVVVPTSEVELERLRKIETGLNDLVALRKETLKHVRAQIVTERDNGYFYGTNGVIELKEKVVQLRCEISTLEELLNG